MGELIVYGAILGDIIGSTYEVHNVKTENFPLFPYGSQFTDDTVLSVAIADQILHRSGSRLGMRKSYAMWYKQYYRRYPNVGYGQMFSNWAKEDGLSIQRSYGNGAAMRVSAIGYAFKSLQQIQSEVKKSCFYTHYHKEAIKGAEAIASCIFLARTGASKEEISEYVKKYIGYPMNEKLSEIRESYVFNSRASYSVPPAIQAFLESDSYEDAIRKAISIGGDSDTIACMTGGIAEAFYKEIPEAILSKGKLLLDSGLKSVVDQFNAVYL